jgi:nucleoside-diphosphate-sugar epimerase
MKLLILGGMRFTGRALVEAGLARGHRITLFNRGRSAAPPATVEHCIGDRDGGLAALDGGTWDAVIDTSGYVPRLVHASGEALAGRAGHYTFVSSISVYSDSSAAGQDETSPVHTLKDETTEEVTGETYGGLKVLCERAAEAVFPGRTAIVRPGLIVGPHDYTDRFPYWVRHMAGDAEVLAPGTPDAKTQIIDVRDLAEWMIRLAESGIGGVFNATGPDAPLGFADFLESIREGVGGSARLTWVDEAFLLERGVVPWNELPLWVPGAQSGFLRTNVARAIAAGLTFRPLAETARDTWAWDSKRTDAERRAPSASLVGSTLAPERERALLAEWHARAGAESRG